MCACVYDTKDMTRLIENSHVLAKTFFFYVIVVVLPTCEIERVYNMTTAV